MEAKIFKTNEASAKNSGAMDARNHLSNGRSLKSQVSRGKFKILTFFLFVGAFFTFDTCKKDKETDVSRAVVELVNIGGEFEVKEAFEKKEEIVPGSEQSGSFQTDDYDNAKIPYTYKRSADVGCQAFNVNWNCKTIKVSASQNPEDFAVFNPLASVLWPGNLVQGSSLESGIPSSIPITKRQPGNISLAIVSSGSAGATMSRSVDKMQFSSVNQAMNDILSGYGGQGFAQYYFEYKFIETQQELEFALNASYAGMGASAKAKFQMKTDNNYQVVLVKLHQSYFTMVYDDPAGLDGVFTPDITVKDLENYTSNGNPVCYISSVTYGRIFYVLYESTAKRSELEAAMNFSYGGASASADLSYNETMNKTTATVFQLGGNAEGAFTNVMAKDFGAIREFLEKGSNFSAESPGAPVSYTVKYLKNANLVRLNSTMEYEIPQCEATPTENDCPKLPELTTNQVSTIFATTATFGGIIQDVGSPPYYECGVCYSSTAVPTESNMGKKEIILHSGTGLFSGTVGGLTANTKYYARAYAINEVGTALGNTVSFMTANATVGLPSLTTSVTNTTTNSATLGGSITNVGTPEYDKRGVVYSTTELPEIEKCLKNVEISATGLPFNTSVTGLTPGTIYYVRAYAINEVGIQYGNQVKFTTDLNLTEISASGTSYTWASPVLTVNGGADLVITTNGASTTRRIVVNGTANITLKNVVISVSSLQNPLLLNSGANLTLTIEGSNSLTAGSQRAGISVPLGTTITISGTGNLTAKGGIYAAGIGGNYSVSGGNITINSGTITAIGGAGSSDYGGGAGIGGGGGCGIGSRININGGTVSATGGNAVNGGYHKDTDYGGKGGGGGGAGIGGGGGNGGCSGGGKGTAGGDGAINIKSGISVVATGGSKGTGGSSGGYWDSSGGGGGGGGAKIGGGGGGGGGGRAASAWGSGSKGSDGGDANNNTGKGGDGGQGGSSGAGAGGTGGSGGSKTN